MSCELAGLQACNEYLLCTHVHLGARARAVTMEAGDSRETGFPAFLESIKDSHANLRGASGLVAASDRTLVFPWGDQNEGFSKQVGTAAIVIHQPWAEKAQNFPAYLLAYEN